MNDDLKFGIRVPVVAGIAADPDVTARFAIHAEACGFDEIVTAEHVVVVRDYRPRYPYAADGRMPLPDTFPFPDPLDVLSFLAGVTQSIGLATGVVVLPNHRPVPLAKRVATIDVLSAGRLRLCVGVGWMVEEIEACGTAFADRGRWTDEAIDVMRLLWSADDRGASFSGRFTSFDGAICRPRPVQPNGVPIHIGGHSIAAAKRAGRRGNGLQPMGIDNDEIGRLVAIMRDEARAHGRPDDKLELTITSPMSAVGLDEMERVRRLGATRLIVNPSRTSNATDLYDEVSRFADRWLVHL